MKRRDIKIVEFRILKKMLLLRLQGRDDVSAGEMARSTGTDAVTALGAMLRMLPTYRGILSGRGDFAIVRR